MPVSPHGFRDAVATTVAITAPAQIRLVTSLLGHRALGTAHRHYNLARGTEAAMAWHQVLGSISERK